MLHWLDVLSLLSAESDLVRALLQIGQLLALEYLVGVALPDKTRQTAVALKALYDEDVVDEVCQTGCTPLILHQGDVQLHACHLIAAIHIGGTPC